MDRLKKTVIISLIALVAAQLIASNVLAGKGRQLVELEQQARKLARENAALREELAEESSLAKIASSAARLGLTEPGSVLYLNLTEPVAQAPSDYGIVP